MWNFTGYLFYCFLDRERKANHTSKWSPWSFIPQLCSGLHSKAFFTINSKHGQFILRLISSTSTGVKHLVLIKTHCLISYATRNIASTQKYGATSHLSCIHSQMLTHWWELPCQALAQLWVSTYGKHDLPADSCSFLTSLCFKSP